MMEEIDFLDPAPNPPPTTKHAAYSDSGKTATAPLRLPRTAARRTFLKDALQSQIPTTEQLHKTRQQAGNVLKGLGNQLGKLNLGKLIDKMEQDQGLADSLEQLNSRMKEEVQRQEVRREAEELTLRVITDHLEEFLQDRPLGTYEEWIQDLHPENANQGQLLTDIQQIDERFYVLESDHRRLWNEAIEAQHHKNNGETYAHRLVKARTQIWGKAPGAPKAESGYTDNKQENQTIDFLSDSDQDPFGAATPTDNGIEEIDFFAPTTNTVATGAAAEAKSNKDNDPFQDLIQF